jgi:hypothetical protein
MKVCIDGVARLEMKESLSEENGAVKVWEVMGT